MEEKLEKTLGEIRVRIDFNQNDNTAVNVIKARTAELIDYVNSTLSENSEQKRLVALALTAYEEAAMWAVKAATA